MIVLENFKENLELKRGHLNSDLDSLSKFTY